MTTTTRPKAGAFSYLPPLTKEQIERQIQYILEQGWFPGIEYTQDITPEETYWHWWKLPFFKAQTPTEVMAEIDACRQTHPECFIQVTAYDNRRQGQVHSFLVHTPGEEVDDE